MRNLNFNFKLRFILSTAIVFISVFVSFQIINCSKNNQDKNEIINPNPEYQIEKKYPDYVQAKQYIEQGESLKARTIFRDLLKKDPDNPYFLYGYALSGMLYNLARSGELLQKMFEIVQQLKLSPNLNLKSDGTSESRVWLDALLHLIFKIIILDTADEFAAEISNFFSKIKEEDKEKFAFGIKKMTINFYVGGESIQKFTLYGKHGVEEAYLLEGIAQIVRTVIYSILSLSYNVDLEHIFKVLDFTKKYGGIFSVFAYPLTVGFPAAMYLIERGERVFTAPFTKEMNLAKEAMIAGAKAILNNQELLIKANENKNKREDFMLFFGDDWKIYIKASLGDEAPKNILSNERGLEGLKETKRGAESVLASLEGKALVLCNDIIGTFTVFIGVLTRSGFITSLLQVAEKSSPDEAKQVAVDFYRGIIYYLDWFYAILSACQQDAILFDFSKFFDLLKNLRGKLPVWFNLGESDYKISTKRNIFLEWECGTSTYDLDFSKLERNFNYLFCARKSVFQDSEHFSAPITLGKGINEILGIKVGEDRINPLSKNPLKKDGVATPMAYMLLPDPSFEGFIRINTKVLWKDCNVPCGAPCDVVELKGQDGLCLINAGLAKLGAYVYGGIE
jgi:hypothetical protein